MFPKLTYGQNLYSNSCEWEQVDYAVEGLFFVSVPAYLPPPTTSYDHCTSVLSLRGPALPVDKYSSIRVGSLDLFLAMTVVIIRFN